MADVTLRNWLKAQEKSDVPAPSFLDAEDGMVSWRKPAVGHLKINVDASIFRESSSFCFAGLARDHEGGLIEAFFRCRMGDVLPEVAEAMGVREALSWLKQRSWTHVIIEIDSLLVVQAIRSSISMVSYFGNIVDECKSLLKECQNVSVLFIKRSANRAAHALARASPIVADCMMFKEDIASSVMDVLVQDVC
ncbi:uncharacterized protein LOC133797237 [Humulus lupulus]|uniref:uncharacterized protein LOC133797237 n=1 Tax=Humulus lupulus TaxID=3486 RepID=UPI002B41534E|nr:uncharacterized protein LOC133797237 [Humulus lupulus]